MTDQLEEAGSRGGAPGGAARGSRERSDPAVIALRMEDVTVWVIERTAKMPRDHKFTVGDKLVETCLEVTTLLVEASFTRDRLGLLAAASRALTRARVLVRVAQRLGLLSSAQREHFARESVEVGKMLGGWTRATRAR
ncbi:MAG: four helix bundle protein [Deltaproteobacteria bacterium]|nr:four helix bundle protein [Deltaproteobacteria bacterium]